MSLPSKTVKPTFDYLFSIYKNVGYKDIAIPFKAENLVLNLKDENLILSFDAEINKKLDEIYKGRIGEIKLLNDTTELTIPYNQSYFNCPLPFIQEKAQMSVKILECFSNNTDWNKPQYLRNIRKIDRDNWQHNIRTFGFQEEGRGIFGGVLILKNELFSLEVYPYFYNDDTFLIIESLKPITKKEFDKLSFSVCVALGIITQNIWQGSCFTVAYPNGDLKEPVGVYYNSLAPSIRGSYQIFSTNIYSIHHALSLYDETEYAAKLLEKDNGEVDGHKIDWLQPDFMANLVKLLYENENVLRTAMTMVNVSGLPLETQPAILSVCLESLSKKIKEEKSESVNPLDSSVYRKLLKGIRKVFNELQKTEKISEEGIRIINKKFNALNNPTNKDSLSNPFEKIGYELTKEEEIAIEYRDTFLHGGFWKDNDRPSEDKEADKMMGIVLRLHKLCSIILFYLAGFDSFLLNNPVLWQTEEELKNQELPLIDFSKFTPKP